MQHYYILTEPRALRPGDVAVCGHVRPVFERDTPVDLRCPVCAAVARSEEQ